MRVNPLRQLHEQTVEVEPTKSSAISNPGIAALPPRLFNILNILISGSSAIPRLFRSQCLPWLAYGTLAHSLLGLSSAISLFSHPSALQPSLGSSGVSVCHGWLMGHWLTPCLGSSAISLFSHPQPISISTTSFFSSGGIVFFAWLEC